MSLFKQLQLLISMLLIATIIIVLKINFNNAREYTDRQLFNSGKNIANVLALSLSSHPEDQAFVETGINAMFDGGSFEEIALLDQNGKEVFKRHEKIVVDGVPHLFINFLNFNIPTAEAQVMSGWNISGTLKVRSHPGPSYLKLWETFKQLCVLFLILGGVTISASYVILKYLLKSLNLIESQASAISHNEFIINENVPNTPELKKVVTAMNIMVEKVHTIYARQLEYLKNYQELNFRDDRTELHNRKYFTKQLGLFLGSNNEKSRGYVLLFSLDGLESMRRSPGHNTLKNIYRKLAEILEKETMAAEEAVTACLNGEEFACILPGVNNGKGLLIGNAVVSEFRKLIDSAPDMPDSIIVAAGGSAYDFDDNLNTVLSQADYALSTAKGKPSGSAVEFRSNCSKHVPGKEEWRDIIEDALFQKRFILTAQPVQSGEGELHREVFVNLIDINGAEQRAGFFMPMVNALGLSVRMDKYVMESTANYIAGNPGAVLAVNLTTELLRDREATLWFRQFLVSNKSYQNRMVFEINDNALTQYPFICLDLSGLIRGMGFQFGIDQFTMGENSLSLLKELNPDYIKVDHGFLYDHEDPAKTELALNSLITITDSLDIKLIAAKIENDEDRSVLSSKNIYYFQGRGISGIEPL